MDMAYTINRPQSSKFFPYFFPFQAQAANPALCAICKPHIGSISLFLFFGYGRPIWFASICIRIPPISFKSKGTKRYFTLYFLGTQRTHRRRFFQPHKLFELMTTFDTYIFVYGHLGYFTIWWPRLLYYTRELLRCRSKTSRSQSAS